MSNKQKSQPLDIINIDNPHATASISLFGAHLLSFKPKHDNRERLWISENAVLDGSKPIRGGVPICWPWFGPNSQDDTLPAHGYVRNILWQLIEQQENDNGTRLVLKPKLNNTLPGYIAGLSCTLELHIGKQLNIRLISENHGDTPVTMNAALHSYFAISDITNIKLEGISGPYIDKTRNGQQLITLSPYNISEETDRIHLFTGPMVKLFDIEQTTTIQSQGHDSLVVWNPWQEKSRSMADMADDSYKTMICVESAITQNLFLPAGENHTLSQIIS